MYNADKKLKELRKIFSDALPKLKRNEYETDTETVFYLNDLKMRVEDCIDETLLYLCGGKKMDFVNNGFSIGREIYSKIKQLQTKSLNGDETAFKKLNKIIITLEENEV